MIKITTKKLILRDLKASDAKSNFKHFNNKKILKNFSEFSYPLDFKKTSDWIKKTSRHLKNERRNEYHLAIELKEKPGLIGSISIKDVDDFNGTCEIAYWLSEEYWGNGIMYEALKKTIDFCFVKLKLRRININAFASNHASNGLIRKVGFVFEGTRKEYKKSRADGKIYDLDEYGFLKKNWIKRKK